MRGPDRKSVSKVRSLRRDATDAETKLWLALRDRRLGGYKFVRQEPIGRYIVDFLCRKQKLVVEVDGGQHADSLTDRVRDAFITKHDYRILRVWNTDVLANIEGVLTTILSMLNNES
jgi:very-short-patch-repair endonuclease